MTEIINKWFKLFGLTVWESQVTRTTSGKYVETNVTDSMVKELQERTARDESMFRSEKASHKLGVGNAS